MKKWAFYINENKDADQLCSSSVHLIGDFVFLSWIVQFLFFVHILDFKLLVDSVMVQAGLC